MISSPRAPFDPGLSAVVVAPTFNNVATLAGVLHSVSAQGLPVIVVNDGSTDDTARILNDWTSESADRFVVTHPHNQGKAAALRSGFALAAVLGFTHGVTIDTDGQLDATDIAPVLARAEREPEALVVGVRDARQPDYPMLSRLGRAISNWLVRLESGVRVADSQCGLRVYPLDLLNSVRCDAEHYGFETEIITRAGWAGRSVVGEPVSCRYLPTAERVSHFKPFTDSLRAFGMHTRLLATALGRWMNPLTAWRQLRTDRTCHRRFAAGLAVGVFVANLPLYGVQTVVSLFLARRLRLHPVSVVAGSNFSIPPIAPLLIAGGIAIGHLLLHGSWPALHEFNIVRSGVPGVLLPLIGEWIIGGLVLGALLAGITFLLADWALRFATVDGVVVRGTGAAYSSVTVRRPRRERVIDHISSTYRPCRAACRFVWFCTIRAKVIGEEYAELAGGGIVACTHFSHLDPVLVSALMRRQIDWMTRIEFFRICWLKRLLLRLGAFSVHRQGVPVSAIRTAITRTKDGRLIGICPEGGVVRGTDSVCRGGAIKRGVCLVAERSGVPIVPCVIVGSHALNRVGPWLPFRRARLWIAFGEPLYPPRGGTSNRASRAALAAELQQRFERLYQRLLREHGLTDQSIP